MSVRVTTGYRALVSWFAFSCVWLLAASARAEDLVIKRAGRHHDYSVELEPHGDVGFFVPEAGSGVGFGGRATIPIVRNGFVKSINNSVGIGFGLDWVHYNGCFFVRNVVGECAALNRVWIPVVMQWNFYLSPHWSIFAEPGLAFAYSDWGAGCVVDNQLPGGTFVCGAAPNRLDFEPVVIFVGGRYQFSDQASLTMRIGWPYASIGVSFFP